MEVQGQQTRPYINHQIQHIRRMSKSAVSRELLPETMYRALATVPSLKKGRTKAPEPRSICPVPHEVVDATLPYLPPVAADMVRFHRLVGCRPSPKQPLRFVPPPRNHGKMGR